MHATNDGVRDRSIAALATRLAGGAVAVGSMLALVAGVGAASAAPTADQSPHKSYICKYVSKPGEAERLQTGQNPIWTDNHSLLGYDGETYVGQQFKDGQFRSVVIVANTPKLNPEPSVSACTTPTPPPSTPPTSPPPSKPTTPPPSTTTHTTTSSTTTHTSPPSTTTSSSGPASTVTTYPLQPVNAGATSDPFALRGLTPVQGLLLLLALLGLSVLVISARFPRRLQFRRIGSPRE